MSASMLAGDTNSAGIAASLRTDIDPTGQLANDKRAGQRPDQITDQHLQTKLKHSIQASCHGVQRHRHRLADQGPESRYRAVQAWGTG